MARYASGLIAALVGCLALHEVLSLAQQPGQQPPPPTLVFEGGVMTKAGGDVAGASVSVTGPSGTWPTAVTDQFGHYGTAGLYVAGVYTISASFDKLEVRDTVVVPNLPIPPDDRTETFVVNLSFDGGSRVTGAYLIPVYFATSRQRLSASPPRYGTEPNAPNDPLQFGVATVSMPLRHKVGRIEKARWEFLADADRHIVVTGGNELTGQQFAVATGESAGSPDVLVFVHGFNVTFREALEAAAQLAYDIGFTGEVILYSWPSGSFVLPTQASGQYRFAQGQIDQGGEYVRLASFLQDVAERYKRAHLLAHSMGAYLSMRSFRNVQRGRWANVVFAAPDISRTVFDAEARYLVQLTRALTVYFNPTDRALAASQAQNWNFPRAGASCTPYLEVDCIDASNLRTGLTRHSYYGDNRSILADIRLVTCRDAPPSQRALRATPVKNAWTVRDQPAAQPRECAF